MEVFGLEVTGIEINYKNWKVYPQKGEAEPQAKFKKHIAVKRFEKKNTAALVNVLISVFYTPFSQTR